jgi:hypothetical protein
MATNSTVSLLLVYIMVCVAFLRFYKWSVPTSFGLIHHREIVHQTNPFPDM